MHVCLCIFFHLFPYILEKDKRKKIRVWSGRTVFESALKHACMKLRETGESAKHEGET